MLFPLPLYGVHIGLFVFCHATGQMITYDGLILIHISGMTHKLERTDVRARSEVKRSGQKDTVSRQVVKKEISEKYYSREDESGYLTDSDRELETD